MSPRAPPERARAIARRALHRTVPTACAYSLNNTLILALTYDALRAYRGAERNRSHSPCGSEHRAAYSVTQGPMHQYLARPSCPSSESRQEKSARVGFFFLRGVSTLRIGKQSRLPVGALFSGLAAVKRLLPERRRPTRLARSSAANVLSNDCAATFAEPAMLRALPGLVSPQPATEIARSPPPTLPPPQPTKTTSACPPSVRSVSPRSLCRASLQVQGSRVPRWR